MNESMNESMEVYLKAEPQQWRVSFTSCMREVVIALCEHLNVRYTAQGGKVFIYCTAQQKFHFDIRLNVLKKNWASSVKKLNEMIIDQL